MSRFTVGCVPYLNAKPLVRRFHDLGEGSPVRVVYDVPSRLPWLLKSGKAQAILVSSIEALRAPCRVADGVAIASQGEVRSVRLFSKVPLEEVRTLALDQSSMTSNALAQMALPRGVSTMPMPPDLGAMLKAADAGVLIGDAGMRASGEGLHVLDLGSAWRQMTGLPFVWAVWLGGDRLSLELADELRASAGWGVENLAGIVPGSAAETGFSEAETESYFRDVMDYRLGEGHKAGLAEFGKRLVGAGFLDQSFVPDWI